MLMLSLTTIYSVDDLLLEWRFNEGAGSILFDSSGYNNNGLITNEIWVTRPVLFDSYSLYFNRRDSFISSLSNANTPDKITLSVWFYPIIYNDYYLFTIKDTDELLSLEYNYAGGNIIVNYINNNLEPAQVIISNTITNYNWHNIILSMDLINDTLSLWYDNSLLVNNYTLPGGYHKSNTLKVLTLGRGLNNYPFDGYLEDFKIMSGLINSSEVNEIYTTGKITIIKSEDDNNTVIDNVNKTNFISTSLDNVTVLDSLEYNLELFSEQKATCFIYLDKSLYTEFNILNYNVVKFEFDKANQKQIDINCYYYENNTLIYDYKNYKFNITLPTNTVTFIVTGKDFDVNNESLYIATPCPNEGYSAIGVKTGYQPKYNPGGIYWQRLDNGIATFNLSEGNYNFCIFNGRVNYEEDNFTTNYNVLSKNGILNLGNLSIPSKLNYVYKISLEKFEIYDKINPKAYGKSWAGLFSSIIGLILGSIILMVGLETRNGKITIAGTILVLFALGFTFNGLVGVLI